MGKIIYYSNFCNNCKELLNIITKTDLVKDIHFICIDKRNQKNGKTYVILETNQEVVLPNNITSVPALLILHDNFKTYFGEDILEYLKPIQKDQIDTATNFEGEPDAYAISNSLSGVTSDNYSFLDQTSDDLMAKGSGGLRQMHSYATLNYNDKIETPPDEYTPDKIGEIDLDKINISRNKEIT